jgi:hypothetical protein
MKLYQFRFIVIVFRWEKIAELMQRTAAEVAHMAHKFKDGFKPLQKQV